MTLVAALPLLVCVLGLIVYLAAGKEQPRLQEVGRLSFAVGLLAFLLANAHRLVTL